MKENNVVIMDRLCNTGREYIDESGANVALPEDASRFSPEEAAALIKANGWENWAVIIPEENI